MATKAYQAYFIPKPFQLNNKLHHHHHEIHVDHHDDQIYDVIHLTKDDQMKYHNFQYVNMELMESELSKVLNWDLFQDQQQQQAYDYQTTNLCCAIL